MPFSKRITIERHKDGDETGCAGLIEGETDSGEKWVLFLDADGKPEVYWPERSEDGAVVGEGISMKNAWGALEGHLKPQEGEEMIASFPVWEDGIRAIIFAVTPENWHGRPGQEDRPSPTSIRLMGVVARLDHDRVTGGQATDGWEIDDEDCEAASFRQASAEALLDELAQAIARDGKKDSEKRIAKMKEILACGTPEDVVTRFQGAVDAIEKYNSGSDPVHNAEVKMAIEALRQKL